LGVRIALAGVVLIACSCHCAAYDHGQYNALVHDGSTGDGACVAPGTMCAGRCVDLHADDSNCGACGSVCAPDETCTAAVCRLRDVPDGAMADAVESDPAFDAAGPDAVLDAVVDVPADRPAPDVITDATLDHATDVAIEAASDVAAPDITSVDAPALVTVSFGENGMTDLSGVTLDTFLSATAPATPHGNAQVVSVDAMAAETGLLRFDISAIPATATIVSVTLHLWTDTGTTSSGGTVSIGDVLENWSERQATWNERMPGVSWTTAGALPPGSSSATAIAMFDPTAIDTEYVIRLPAASIARWLTGRNSGVALTMTSSDGADFVSSQGPTTAHRPWLVVQYHL
jgi:hypothetical protein